MEALQRLHNRGSISTGYDIDNSLKFESDNSEYLNRTPGANGSLTTWTTSVWVKRTEIGVDQAVFSSVSSAQTTNFCRFLSSDKIRFYFQPNDVAATYYADTNAVFRDTSAWYHIVWGLDSTNSDGSKRFVVYVNGVYQESTWAGSATASTNCPQNSGSRFLQSEPIYIGNATYTNGHYFNGYMAELHVLDGIAPDPTDFGEYDEDSGIWKPKAYTGSHGTQGFYLDFADAADLGDDESGNGNDFTENNITAADQATDTPTNNFCTFNTLSVVGTSTYTEGGTVGQANKQNDQGEGTIMFSSGNWYFEMQVPSSSASSDAMFGFAIPNEWGPSNPGDDSGKGFSAHSVGRWYYNNNGSTSTDSSAAFAKGDIVSLAINTSSEKAWVAINGTWATGTNPATGTGGFSYGTLLTSWESGSYLVPAFRTHFVSGSKSNANFGGYTVISISTPASDENGYGTFEYAPPSGYYALCTKNLEEYG